MGTRSLAVLAIFLIDAFGQTPPQPQRLSEIRPAVQRSLSLLTRSGEQWFTKQQCISNRGARAIAEDGVKPTFNASALLLAVSTGEREKVSALLAYDHNLNQSMLAGGFARSTPLALALYNGDTQMMRLLVKAGANSNEEQQADLSPLSILARRWQDVGKTSAIEPQAASALVLMTRTAGVWTRTRRSFD